MRSIFCIIDFDLRDFIQKLCIFDAETSILTLFRFNLWTTDHKKTLDAQGFVVVLPLKYIFQKKKHFSERYSLVCHFFVNRAVFVDCFQLLFLNRFESQQNLCIVADRFKESVSFFCDMVSIFDKWLFDNNILFV